MWLRAKKQTAGRGRIGRAWQSPVGNLYASTLVRLQPHDPPAATLAFVAAVALHEIVVTYAHHRPVSIKWPNDLLIDGAKLAGILLERADDAIIIGIGVNLGFHPDGLDRPVTSLAAQGLDTPDPGYFCEDLARAFARWLSRWRGEGMAVIRQVWLAAAHPIGTALTANLSDSSACDGLFDGLDNDGALRLRLADGSVRAIHAGDVFLI
jgi:BirA family transcriptional regulator, biotin operon repressor / biotin---[acetyl-CoA-carboxylase] ligase